MAKPKREALRYSVQTRWSNEDEAWIAEVPDLPGCMADGPTPDEAVRAVEEVARIWIEVAREDGRDIPAPLEASGRFVLRLPRSLHQRLQELARREEVSLNVLVTSMLAVQVGESKARPRR